MRKMKFKPKYLKLLINGKKRSTIRLEKKYREGEVVYIADTDGRIYGKARIIRIQEKSIKNLNKADAVIDGFEDVRELREALYDIYGKLSRDKKIYIYYLEILGWWKEV
jgi:hypothetical protein